MGVEPKIGGKPPKWMVKIMENPIKMDDLGVPLFLETSISHQTGSFGKSSTQAGAKKGWDIIDRFVESTLPENKSKST